jgi:proteic killer suppression protein
VDVIFADEHLDRLEADEDEKTRLDKGVVRSYREAMRLIRDAIDERDIRHIFGPKNFYPLQGDRSHQHAMRLNRQWRLIIEIQKSIPKNRIRVVAIEDYH